MSDGLTLDPSWPGLSVPDDGVDIDPDVLDEIAGELEEEAGTLRSASTPGSVNKLSQSGQLPPGSFGNWTTGADMQAGYNDAHVWIVHYYEEMVSALEQAAALLRATATQHRHGDDLSGSGFQAQWGALGNQRGGGGNPAAVA